MLTNERQNLIVQMVEQSYISNEFDVVTAVTFAKIDKCWIVTDKVVKDKYKNATFIKEVREG